jgi:hypothetical protein
MRYVSMFVVVALVFVFALGLATFAAAEPLTTRPIDPIAAEALNRAMARSSTVRALVAALEASNVIVHIQSARSLAPGISGTTTFVTSRGGHRYLRITIHAGLPARTRAIILAHELRHACEIAESGAADLGSVRELFERAGHRVGEFFETRAAIDTERLVRKEIGLRTLQSEPVAKFDH